jgi:uroporphyrinogen decarboxylase
MSTLTSSPYLAALRGEQSDRIPIWMMRQAGRYLPEYRALREKHAFIEMCETPELACEVTLQPIRRFGFDAAILFCDILIPLTPMGAPFAFDKGGPKMAQPLRSEADIDQLTVVESEAHLGFVGDAIRMIKGELGDTPLIGFAGAPFTLATYLIEGGSSKDFKEIKSLLYSRPELVARLLDLLADQTADYLLMQARAGVDAIQLFDTWGGILTPADYQRFILPGIQKIFARLEGCGVPRILFMKGGVPFISHMVRSGADAYGVDWSIDLASFAEKAPGVPLQGNLDPLVLFGSQEEIRHRAEAVCRFGEAATGHVFNLGHGILPQTPIESVETLVQVVQSYRRGQ